MKKTFILATLTLLVTVISNTGLNAQSCAKKAGISGKEKVCEPKSCKPGDTKKQEAAVITGLRNDLLTIGEALAAKSVGIRTKDTIAVGKDDEESLHLIVRYAQSLHKDLVTGSAAYSLEFDVEDISQYHTNKAQLVALVRDYLTNLRKWTGNI